MKNKKGITLIALVISIIVLLILAGVSLQALIGDNGILTQATKSKEKTDDNEVVDAVALAWNAKMTQYYEDLAKGQATASSKSQYVSKENLNELLGDVGRIENITYDETQGLYLATFMSNKNNKTYGIVIDSQGKLDIRFTTSQEEYEERLANGENLFETPETLANLPEIELDSSKRSFVDMPESGDRYDIPSTVTIDSVTYRVSSLNMDFLAIMTNDNIGTYDYVTIPNTVTSLLDSSWSIWSSQINVKSIYIPSSVTTFGQNLFENSMLENIYVDPNHQTIKDVDGVAYSKSGKTLIAYPRERTDSSFTIPSGVETIGQYSFHYAKLVNVTIPNSLKKINAYAFHYSRQLENFNIPNNVESVGENAFSGSSITSLTISNKVTKISDELCQYCSNLETVSINGNVTEIGENAFYACNSLSSINLPNTLQKIKREAFKDCRSLQTITIPSSVTYIDDYAFDGCNNINIVFENVNNLTHVGYNAFPNQSCMNSASWNYISSIMESSPEIIRKELSGGPNSSYIWSEQ